MSANQFNNDIPEFYEYWVSQAIRRTMKDQNEQTVRVVFYTDPHHMPGGNQLRTAAVIRQLAQNISVDAIVCGGDFSENGPKEEVERSQMEILNALRVRECPVFPVKGNHDDNSIQDFHLKTGGVDHVIFPQQSYEDWLKPLEGKVVFDKGNECGLYYYYDIPGKKTRIAILNSIDIPYQTADSGELKHNGQWEYAFSERQLDWVERKVFDFGRQPSSDEWKVLIFSHVAIIQDGLEGVDHDVANGEAMWDIIRRNQKHVAACFFGHVHCDQVLVRDGIPMISTLNAATYGRLIDMASETAFDIVSLNEAKNELSIIRFGAGEDRSIRI